MGIKAAINGFGRIGRLILRCAEGVDDIEFVAINDITDAQTLAHLLKYDSVHGTDDADIRTEGDKLMVNGRSIPVFAVKNPEDLPWKEHEVDIVFEATGIFRKKEECEKHLAAGAKRVVITAPAKGSKPVKMLVMGVNESDYDPHDDKIVSNASCTTNCLAPVVKVLHDNFRIQSGLMTTIHSYTNDQRILDAPHKDLRRARAAAVSMIPTTTGAATAVTKVIPDLAGKMNGMAIRVPTPNVSLVDFTAAVERPASVEQINNAVKKAAENELKGILEYTEIPLVSCDYIGHPASSIFDAPSTMVLNDKLIKVLAWYDNEYGYSCRTRDLALYMMKRGI